MGALVGKVAVVTGAGRGIGRAVAHHLAREGARVVVNDTGGSVDGAGGDSSVAEVVATEIRSAGGTALASTDSVASWEGGRRIVEAALDTYGGIHILVNNAGILRDQFFHRMTEAQWDAVLDVHLMGSFTCSRAAAPHLRNQQWGRIVFITSTAGFIGTIGQANYGAAKMGIVGLSRQIAVEMQGRNVTSNCVAPFAWTRIPESIPAVTDEIRQGVDRLFQHMTPEDISPLVVFLATEQAAGISGQIVGVRGKEIYVFSQPRVVRSLHSTGGWTQEGLEGTLEATLKPHFTPLDNSITYFTWKALV